MTKEQRVINYYVLCNKLKDVVRTGWKNWHVDRERVESVAEHVYGVQMLALAIESEYHYDIDITKVVMMLAVHELEEIIIGDLTMFQISKEEKEKIGHPGVIKVLENLSNEEYIYNLVTEFDEGKTKEAKFAYQCDKLECDLQSKIYDEQQCVDLNDQDDNNTAKHPKVAELLNEGMSWSEMWLRFGQYKYPYDENFIAISNYAIDNHITDEPVDRFSCRMSSIDEFLTGENELTTNPKDKSHENCITYYGYIGDVVVCEATAITQEEGLKDIVGNPENLCNRTRAFITNVRIADEQKGKKYFSKLSRYMEKDLKSRGFEELTIGVKPEETDNIEMIFHLGFLNYLKTSIELVGEQKDQEQTINYYLKKV